MDAKTTMNRGLGFLSDKVATHDIVLVKVLCSPRPQVLRAKVARIYSAKKGMAANCLGSEIEFVQSPGHWGDVGLAVGDQALLFVRSISGQLYEDAWRGHMVVEEIEGNLYAIFQFKELWLNEDVPSSIRENSRQDPKRPYATAIRFDALESYLLGLIENAERGGR